MKRLLLVAIILIMLVGCSPIPTESQTSESSIASSQASTPDIKSPEVISQTEDKKPDTNKQAIEQNYDEKLDKERQVTKNDTVTKSKQTASQPLVSPSQTGIVQYQQVTNGHVGPIVVKNFPRGKIHKRENLNISWSAEGAVGYTLWWRAGLQGSSDEGNPNTRTSLNIVGSSLDEGTKIEMQIYAAGPEGIKLNNSLWLGNFIMLTLYPPVITNLGNEPFVEKDKVTLNWNSTFDSKRLPFSSMSDYIIKVKDLGNNQIAFSTNLHEEYPKQYRNFTFPNTVFISGHNYSISLEEQFIYQDYISDQGPMVDSIIISVK